jgi:hypothetical protein
VPQKGNIVQTLLLPVSMKVLDVSKHYSNKMEIKHVHKNMHCLKSIKEDDDGSQLESKVNGDHRMPWCTNIFSVTLGSASRA